MTSVFYAAIERALAPDVSASSKPTFCEVSRMDGPSVATGDALSQSVERRVVGRKRKEQPVPVEAPPPRQTGQGRRRLGLTLLAIVVILGHGGSWAYPGWWIGVWAGHASLILLATMLTPRKAFWMGTIVGILANGWAFHWAPSALERCMSASLWQRFTLFSGLVAWESVEFGLFCWLAALATQGGLRGIFLVPPAWVVAEHYWPKIFPWLLGYSQMELLPLIQIADVTGPCGIGFCITAVAALPAAINLRRRSPRSSESAWLVGYCLSVCVLLSGVLGYGFQQMERWRAKDADAPSLRIAAMQFDTSVTDSDFKLRNSAAAFDEQVDLVCWPESAFGTYCEELTSFSQPENVLALSRESFDRLRPTQDCRCDLLAAGRTYAANATEEGPYRMTAFLVDGQENIVSTYHKRTLLPFGEYMPGQTYLPVLREWATLGDVIEAGTSAKPITSSSGARLGVVICYEDLLRGNARETVREGAEILISLVNDAAFENPLVVRQHYRLAMMRAIENRRYFVRCAGTGVSSVIAPTGEVLDELAPGEEGILQQQLALHREQTVYTRCGEVFPLCCGLLCLVGFGWLHRATLRDYFARRLTA